MPATMTKKRRSGTGAESLARQAIYLAKLAKAKHGKDLSISGQALGELERVFDFVTESLMTNCQASMKMMKTKTLSLKVARCASEVTFTGRLREDATVRGARAVMNYEKRATATEPASVSAA